jgi:amino acid permease
MKNILIIIGILLLLLIGGYYIFPFVVMTFKSLIGVFFILLIAIGVYIGYKLPKRRKNE